MFPSRDLVVGERGCVITASSLSSETCLLEKTVWLMKGVFRNIMPLLLYHVVEKPLLLRMVILLLLLLLLL
jgi:hypothetical protein